MMLVEFLEARIAEDEARAKSIESVTYRPRWWTDAGGEMLESPPPLPDMRVRLLAECEVKREIVRRCRRERGRFDQFGESVGNPVQAVVAWEAAVRLLAAIYSDHEDYRAEWRP
jgi:hypothetical protein